ncbi:MAG TPA: hypothetical protein VE994_20530, partial [Terriglobales bacterium]|nr:hypothetical protein [Terriglobales bacterium]
MRGSARVREQSWRSHLDRFSGYGANPDDIMTVKELLGHSTVTVTMRYTHSNLGSKALAVRKLEGAATILLHSAPECSSTTGLCS